MFRRRRRIHKRNKHDCGEPHRDCTTLLNVPKGWQATIIKIRRCIPQSRIDHLQAYGFSKGQIVRVMQRRPVLVVRVDHTEVALEHSLADGVVVEDIHRIGTKKNSPKPV